MRKKLSSDIGLIGLATHGMTTAAQRELMAMRATQHTHEVVSTYQEEFSEVDSEPGITIQEHRNWHKQAGTLTGAVYNATSYKSKGTNKTSPKKKRKKR